MAMYSEDYQHFVCIVTGDNPEELMKKYDKNLKVDKYVVYKFADKDKLKENYLAMLAAFINNRDTLSDDEYEAIQEMIQEIQGESAEDFFMEYTESLEHDPETGDATSTENPNGKWSSHQIGKIFSVPFLLKDGREQFHGKKKEIAWDLIHRANTERYERTWEMCMEGSKPTNDIEKQMYENMKNRTVYLGKFETKENYVDSNTSFWGYAFLSEETGWVELEPNVNQFEWVNSYYDRFIKPLPEDTELTIYECVR